MSAISPGDPLRHGLCPRLERDAHVRAREVGGAELPGEHAVRALRGDETSALVEAHGLVDAADGAVVLPRDAPGTFEGARRHFCPEGRRLGVDLDLDGGELAAAQADLLEPEALRRDGRWLRLGEAAEVRAHLGVAGELGGHLLPGRGAHPADQGPGRAALAKHLGAEQREALGRLRRLGDELHGAAPPQRRRARDPPDRSAGRWRARRVEEAQAVDLAGDGRALGDHRPLHDLVEDLVLRLTGGDRRVVVVPEADEAGRARAGLDLGLVVTELRFLWRKMRVATGANRTLPDGSRA